MSQRKSYLITFDSDRSDVSEIDRTVKTLNGSSIISRWTTMTNFFFLAINNLTEEDLVVLKLRFTVINIEEIPGNV